MAIGPLLAGDPVTTKPARSSWRARFRPLALATTSAVLLWLAFPPAEWNWLAWGALVPLFLLIQGERPKFSTYLGTYGGGFVFWLLAIHWVWWTDETALLGLVVMSAVLALWWPGFLLVARFVTRRLQLPTLVVAPVAWVGLEYLRAHVLTGFPWYYLAHTQYRIAYLTQISDFTGSLGLSFLIAVVNAYVVDVLSLPLFRPMAKGSAWARLAGPQKARLVAVAGFVLATLGYGLFRVELASFRPGPRVALLQTNEVQEYNSDRKKSPEKLAAQLEALTLRALDQTPPPDLIVWPETSYPYGYVQIDPKIDTKTLDGQVKEIHPEYVAADWTLKRDRIDTYFDRLTRSVKVPIMVGSTLYDFRPERYSKYNSAILFQLGSAYQVYQKLHLVPFGEYVPLIDVFPWLQALTPYRGTRLHFLDFGAEPAWFSLGPWRLAVAICFEDTVPHVVRRFFAEAPEGRQPDLLVNMSNDGWFHETSEHEMHLAVSTFRCVENRTPMVRSVNTGVSALVDGNGRIVETMAKNVEGVLTVTAPLDDRTSLYSQWGDWLGLSCLASSLGMAFLAIFAPRRGPTDRDDAVI
jgi:apolipoprotein N-acyltransferase